MILNFVVHLFFLFKTHWSFSEIMNKAVIKVSPFNFSLTLQGGKHFRKDRIEGMQKKILECIDDQMQRPLHINILYLLLFCLKLLHFAVIGTIYSQSRPLCTAELNTAIHIEGWFSLVTHAQHARVWKKMIKLVGPRLEFHLGFCISFCEVKIHTYIK